MTEYVTAISSPVHEPPELQVLHKLPMTEPSREDRTVTEEEHAEWMAAYKDELTRPGTEAEVLQRAGERTAHLWGARQPEADREAGS